MKKTRKSTAWCCTIFKWLSHHGFKSTWYLLKTISKIQNHSINYFKKGVCDSKWKIHGKKFQWNGWIFFRKYYCMKIFLHFGIILLYSNYIEKKAWKTFNSFKMQILLVYKYNKIGNGNSKTTKRKSRIASFLESLFNFNLGGLLGVCFEVWRCFLRFLKFGT